MPKASIKLPNGTSVVVEGSPEEVAKVLHLFGGEASGASARSAGTTKRTNRKRAGFKKSVAKSTKVISDDSPDLSAIINHIKNCDQAKSIGTEVLDKTSQVNRILLPLFIVHEHLGNAYGLTSGEVSKITIDLGIPIRTPNASVSLSGTAANYVVGDRIRKKGKPVRYKLSRQGVQYFKEVLGGKADGK